MKRVLTFLSLSVLLAGTMAYAKTNKKKCKAKRLVVVPYPFRDGTAQRTARDFTTAVAMDPCISLSNVYTILEGEDNNALVLVDEAQQKLNRGIRAFAAGSYDKAANLLQDAVRLYLPNYAAAGMSRDVTDAYLYLGSALAALNRTKPARQAFPMALTLDPAADIYSVTSIPDATDVFQAVRNEIGHMPVGNLVVTSTPKGALVYVDGSFKGATPITVTGLRAGKHVIALMMVGFKRETRVVDIQAGETAQPDPVTLASTARATLLGREITRLLNNDDKAYVDAKSLLATDFMVVNQKTAMGMQTYLFDLDHRLVFSHRQAIHGVRMAKQVLDGLLARANRKLEVRIPALPGNKQRASSSIVKKWWFWTAIGAVVVGGTTAAILLTRHHGSTGMKKDGTGAIIVEF